MPAQPGGPEPALELLLERLVVLCDPSEVDRLTELAGRLQTGSLRVLLAGEAKRGKSTLANALIGRDVLPSGVTPVTSLATEIRQGEPERIEVTFEDGRTMTGPVGDLHLYVGEKDNPQNTKRVAQVATFLSEGLPHPRMVLVDTPGVGSVHAHNTEAAAAAAAYDSMDAAVFVLTADAPLSANELELLHEISELSVRRFVVLNKADLIDDSEIPEVLAFIEDSVESETGERPHVIPCSARRALRAGATRDREGWRSSGVPELRGALESELVEHREDDVRRSVGQAARRVAARGVDECATTLAAIRAVSERRDAQVGTFADRLAETSHRSREAVRLVSSQTSADLGALTEEAQRHVRALTRSTLDALGRVVARSADLTAAELDAVGRQTMTDVVRDGVDTWRLEQYRLLTDSLDAQAERQQSLLRRDAQDLTDVVKEVLGVDLVSPAVTLPATTLPGLPLDFARQASWNSSVVDALRTSGPAEPARRRVAGHLRDECYGLVDKGVGRARSDLQTLMTDATRQLAARVAQAFAEQASGLRRAHLAASESVSRSSVDRAETERTLAGRLEALRGVVRSLAEITTVGGSR